ncbi:MAG: hypothetical protein KC431_05285, partial [Myxococcales bacterium]|nr:hypothetical protein [Myxococcales bacterium]
PGVVTWNELPGVTTITDFRPFVFGLLADCGEVTCKLRDDNQVIEDPIDLPSGAIWGTWRSDAWIVTVEDEEGPEPEDPRDGMQIRVTTEYKRWRRNDFVLQEREVNDFGADSYYGPDGEGYFAGESFRKGWAGGMLLYERGSFRRLPADGPPAPTVAPPTDMCAFFEAESGAMFFVTVDNFESPKKFTLHPPCAAEGCKAAPLELPTGSSDAPWIWNFHLDVPRGGDAMSFLAHAAAASDEYEDDSQGFIIHYDVSADGVGSWVVEALRLEVDGEVTEIEGTSQLWPDTRGGIWVELDDELYYRSAKGKWFVVEVPGATAYANRLKPREFLALVEEGDATKVLATRDAPKAKPAAP